MGAATSGSSEANHAPPNCDSQGFEPATAKQGSGQMGTPSTLGNSNGVAPSKSANAENGDARCGKQEVPLSLSTSSEGPPVKILALDGGGIKGLNTVWIVQALEAVIGGEVPWDRYDLIVGSSVGGILATDIAMTLRSTGKDLEDLLWAGYRLLIKRCKSVDRLVKGYGISAEVARNFMDKTCPNGEGYAMPFSGGVPCL